MIGLLVSTESNKAAFYRWAPSAGDDERSGTPTALLESIARQGRLLLLDAVEEGQVLVEFPFAERWQERTGCRRFVRLRRPVEGAVYALIQG
jgi:hypothetical protein